MGKNDTTATRTDLSDNAVEEISSNLRRLLADVFTLYVKTKNFHWHISGRHFRDYHLLLDEQGTEIFAITDTIAERVGHRQRGVIGAKWRCDCRTPKSYRKKYEISHTRLETSQLRTAGHELGGSA